LESGRPADRAEAILKILLTSHYFYPSIGGIESVSRRLAGDFVAAGREVRVATLTAEPGKEELGYEVIRRPSPLQLLSLARWCDVYFQNNISLTLGWPLLFVPRPWVVAHHTYLARTDLSLGFRDRIKRFLLRFASNISISEPIAKSLPVPSVIIGNPYDDRLFRCDPDIPRAHELVFVGRLVSDKGVNLLVEALVALKTGGLRPRLTIVGEGPEFPSLQQMVVANGLEDQVQFLGYKTGQALVDLLNRHSIMVVPSRWAEPFGLVAIEGIACGCVIVGSEGGGLKDAIGSCGLTFPNNSIEGLRDVLRALLTHPERLEGFRRNAKAHLAQYSRENVARRYLETLARACAGRGTA